MSGQTGNTVIITIYNVTVQQLLLNHCDAMLLATYMTIQQSASELIFSVLKQFYLKVAI